MKCKHYYRGLFIAIAMLFIGVFISVEKTDVAMNNILMTLLIIVPILIVFAYIAHISYHMFIDGGE